MKVSRLPPDEDGLLLVRYVDLQETTLHRITYERHLRNSF